MKTHTILYHLLILLACIALSFQKPNGNTTRPCDNIQTQTHQKYILSRLQTINDKLDKLNQIIASQGTFYKKLQDPTQTQGNN